MSNTQITIRSKPKMTATGIIGSFLFVGSPIIAGITIPRMIAQLELMRQYSIGPQTYSPVISWALILWALTAIGFVMILVGRSYTHRVQISKTDQQ